MPNEESSVVAPTDTEAPKPKRGFQPGHPRYGGARKKTATDQWEPRAIAAANKFEGLAELIEVYRTRKLPITGPGRVAQDASSAQRIRCLELACG